MGTIGEYIYNREIHNCELHLKNMLSWGSEKEIIQAKRTLSHLKQQGIDYMGIDDKKNILIVNFHCIELKTTESGNIVWVFNKEFYYYPNGKYGRYITSLAEMRKRFARLAKGNYYTRNTIDENLPEWFKEIIKSDRLVNMKQVGKNTAGYKAIIPALKVEITLNNSFFWIISNL